jgi:hypothetical protein
MRIGLHSQFAGVGSDVVLDLWSRCPFAACLVPRHKSLGMAGHAAAEAAARGRPVYSLGTCNAAAKNFLSHVDAVLAVGRTSPAQLFYYAREDYGVVTVLLAGTPQDEVRADRYWVRYADFLAALPGEAAESLSETCVLVPGVDRVYETVLALASGVAKGYDSSDAGESGVNK